MQDRHVDVFAVQVGVAVRFVAVAGFEDHVDHVAERLDQRHERVHHARAGDGGHQDGHLGAVLFVAIHVVAEAGAGHDFQVVRRPDGVAELEVAVAGDAEVGFQLFFGELLEAAGRASLALRSRTRW